MAKMCWDEDDDDFDDRFDDRFGNVIIDDTELSRQLKKLGWQKLIPKAGDLAS